MARFHSFLWLNTVLFHMYIPQFFSLFSLQWINTFLKLKKIFFNHQKHFVYYSFFIHLSIDGHLGFSVSWMLWIMLGQTLECAYLFKLNFFFYLDKYLDGGMLDHMVVLFLIVWRSFLLFSIVVPPIYIPSNRGQGLSFLHILPNICYFLPLW